MHGEQAIEDLRRDEGVVGDGELNADEQSFNARDDQEDERVGDVHQADLLVIDRGDPILQDVESQSRRSAGLTVTCVCVAMDPRCCLSEA